MTTIDWKWMPESGSPSPEWEEWIQLQMTVIRARREAKDGS